MLSDSNEAILRPRSATASYRQIIVQRAIATIPGVTEIIVSTDNGTATIVYDERATNPTEFAETVAHAGHPASPIGK